MGCSLCQPGDDNQQDDEYAPPRAPSAADEDVIGQEFFTALDADGFRHGFKPSFTIEQRYNLDNRDQGDKQRFSALNDENGVWPCTFVGACSNVCPKHVDPAGAIQQAKAAAVPYWAASMVTKDKKEA